MERKVINKYDKLHRQSCNLINQNREVDKSFLWNFNNSQAVFAEFICNGFNGRTFTCTHIAVKQAVIASLTLNKGFCIADNDVTLSFVACK